MKDIIALGKNHTTDSKKFLQNKNPIVILYELQGCPHCVAIEKPWENAIKTLKAHKDTKDCIDCANAVFYYDKGIKAKGHKSRLDYLPEQLRGISGFPTIHILNNGSVVDEYNGDRSEESIVEFVVNYTRNNPINNPELNKTKSASVKLEKSTKTPKPPKPQKETKKAAPKNRRQTV